jgi:hypothetical protein
MRHYSIEGIAWLGPFLSHPSLPWDRKGWARGGSSPLVRIERYCLGMRVGSVTGGLILMFGS